MPLSSNRPPRRQKGLTSDELQAENVHGFFGVHRAASARLDS